MIIGNWVTFVALANAADVSDIAEYRVSGTAPSDFEANTDGAHTGQAWALDQRLRAGIDVAGANWRVATEWDFLTGQIAGDTWKIPGVEDERHREALTSLTLDGIRPRRLAAGFDLPFARIDLGLMPSSTWGLGLIANDGNGDPLFGRTDFGDRVVRLRVATRPEPEWTLVLAADVVASDDTADLMRGQLAAQGILAGVWKPADGVTAGVYGVYRHQVEHAFDPADFSVAPDPDAQAVSRVGVVDLFTRVGTHVGGWPVDIGAEAAEITGETARARSYNSPDSLGIISGAAVAKIRTDDPKGHLGILLNGGYLSGDGHPDDATQNGFTADRDFDVGMVLFDEVQGAIDAAAYAQLSDPEYSGHTTDGADALVSEGAVRGSTWVQPAVVVTVLPWLQARAGAVFAWSTAPIAQPFTSFRSGGVPTNHLGVATSGYALGTELDWAIVLGNADPLSPHKLTEPKPKPALILQGGHAFLSEDLGGNRVDVLMATARVRL